VDVDEDPCMMFVVFKGCGNILSRLEMRRAKRKSCLFSIVGGGPSALRARPMDLECSRLESTPGFAAQPFSVDELCASWLLVRRLYGLVGLKLLPLVYCRSNFGVADASSFDK
jgi:hypothetical protein